MSANARSQRLIAYTSAAGALSSAYLTVPAGTIVLVKSIYAYDSVGTGGTVNVGAVSAQGGGGYVYTLSVPANSGAGAQIWFVLNPGDQTVVNASEAGILMWLSGAVLLGTPPITPLG